MSTEAQHIVLVEDSLSQAVKMTHVLENAGWKVTCASTADAFFEILENCRPDLILLDFYLPGVRGDEICRRLRRNIDTRNLPVVMLTSEGTSEAELRGLDSGADDFIGKGSDPAVLVLRLKTLLGKVPRQSEILGSTARPFRSARLLAIDDSPTFLERLRPELESEGYEVHTSADASEALRLVQEAPYDGVIVDLVLPGMDGIEFCRRLDDLRKSMSAPIVTVVLTSEENDESHSRALLAGADDFVGKSNDLSVLKGRIRALLRRKFFEEENRRILTELRQKELQAVRERAEKEAAQARAQLVEQLEQTATELRQSQEKLEQANRAKDQFLAILSHELRTPLTPVLATISLWQDDLTVPAELRKDIAMVRRNIELEARLIDDLLDLTRITSGKLELRQAFMDLESVIRHALEICSTGGDAPTITTDYDFKGEKVWGDASRLTQVIWNLLRNAVKFTPEEGSIKVRGFVEDSAAARCVVVEVEDTGIGIEGDHLPRVFNAFEQGTREITRHFGGLGLGLAISRAIAESHGGTLTARSEGRNRGATFRLALPAATDRHGASTETGAPLKSLEPATSDEHTRLRILVVEDHRDSAVALQRLLTRLSHEVSIAGSVEEARGLLGAGERFDVMISDWGLPDGNGSAILPSISPERRPAAIALTGFGMEQDVKASIDAGFSYHLTKPVDTAALKAALAAVTNLKS